MHKPSLYERMVGTIVKWVKPHLHRVSERFIERSVDEYAKDKPRFARMIEFEVRRRGDGAGLTQDVAEPLLWTGIKTVAAIAIASLTEFMKDPKIKVVGLATAAGIVLNNVVDLFRLVPRYTAGLQGSLEMAKDRWRSIEETGIDPFGEQRQINKGGLSEAALARKRAPVLPTSLMEQANRVSEQDTITR